jgi:ribosomal protein S27AE
MTTENYKKLREWSDRFEQTKCGYVRATKSDMERFSSVYKEIYGKPVTQSQRTCPRCILKLFKQVAEDYWAFEKSPAYKKLIKSERDENDATSVEG